MPAGGGPVERLLPPGRVLTFGGSWSARGTILFGSLEGVLRVSESGGEPSTIEATRGLAFWPSFLPDGDHFLFLGPIEAEKGPRASNLGVHVASLSDQTLRRLILPVIIAIEHAARLVAAHFHRDPLRNAGSDRVANGGSAEVVWMLPGHPALVLARRQAW